MRERQRQLDPSWVARMSELVQHAVLALDEFARAKVVGCYLAAPREVRTELILRRCWDTGRKICVPAWRRQTEEYVWAWLEKEETVEKGRYEILQPADIRAAPPDGIEIALVPGLAFDARGDRIGHGGGYFDGLLSRGTAAAAFKIGLGFAFQVLDAVPAGPGDVGMDAIATENGVLRPDSGTRKGHVVGNVRHAAIQ